MAVNQEFSASNSSPASRSTKRRKPRKKLPTGAYYVPAMILSKPDLSLHTELRNLLDYCLECIRLFANDRGGRCAPAEHFAKSVARLDQLRREHGCSLDKEVRRLLEEFIDDAGHAVNIIRNFIDSSIPPGTGSPPQPVGLLLAAKTTRLQWLIVCLHEEIRRNFTH